MQEEKPKLVAKVSASSPQGTLDHVTVQKVLAHVIHRVSVLVTVTLLTQRPASHQPVSLSVLVTLQSATIVFNAFILATRW